MPLPERVRQNAARAAELIKSNADAKAGKPAAVVSATPSPTPSPTPTPTPAAETPPAGETVEGLKAKLEQANKDLAAAHQRATVLKGKYDKELPQERSARVSAEARVKELDEQLKRKVEAGDLNSLTEDEKKLAGKDLLIVITKAAREVATQEVDAKMRPLSARFDHFEKLTDAQYNALIDHELPEFDKQNNDPQFLAWLQGLDPATGRLRNDLLQDAHAGQQGYRTVEIFKAFKEGREIGARQPTPAVPAGAEARLDPPRGGSEPPPPADQGAGKLITRAEIATFYREKREQKWKGREDQARAFEAEISKALQENRVR
jgi:hypothetical protein